MTSKSMLGILLIAAAVAMTVFWTKPSWDDAQKLVSEKADREDTLHHIQDSRKVYDALVSKYNSISKDNLARLDEMLPDGPDGAILLVNLENLTKANGVQLKNVNLDNQNSSAQVVQGQTAENAVQRLSFTISITASYEAFRAFLTSLEHTRRLIDVDQISFSSAKNDSYQFSVLATTYWK